MASLKRKLKGKQPPDGWEMIEEVIDDFETKMKEAVNEEHEGKRKAELTWKIHRIHWEKNRFIYDLMYQRKVMSKELVRGLLQSTCVGLCMGRGAAATCSCTGTPALNCTGMKLLRISGQQPVGSRLTCNSLAPCASPCCCMQ
jgi:hypothetical protein